MALPQNGKVGLAFSVFNQGGWKVSLKDFKEDRKFLVYFYPKAMARGCTTQAGESRDAKEKLSRQKLVVLGFSPDQVKKFQ